MNAAEVHVADLAAIRARVERARRFAYLHGVGTRDSRRSLASVTRALDYCGKVAAAGAIVLAVAQDGTAAEAGANADRPATPVTHTVCIEERPK